MKYVVIGARKGIVILFLFLFLESLVLAQPQQRDAESKESLLDIMHSISSHTLLSYIEELTDARYAGRLTGTEGYNQSAQWVAQLFKKWGIKPGGDNNTCLQAFPIPYTLVFPQCHVYMHIPYKDSTIIKHYNYVSEYIPGATSGSGEVTAEVVYVGYGITAPELNYDEYKDVDVKGKIVLMEREVPVSPEKEPEKFKQWRPYSFHQYKLENAHKHGAVGMLYNYGPIGNPNNSYRKDFIYSHIGESVVEDIFAGTGKEHKKIVNLIEQTLKPQSFSTGKVFTIKNTTEHHPEGIGYNVVGYIPGIHPQLKNEAIVIGAHLDHLGKCPEIMPGANDNASGVAVVLGAAEALAKYSRQLGRSIIFICFGAEEQGVVGSEYYLNNPLFPLEKTVGFINMDGVGCGDKLSALAAQNFPELWKYIDNANQRYVHRTVQNTYFDNIARPRLDAARFMWKGIPTISFSAYGATSYYHTPRDTIDTITPEILEDLAQIIFLAVVDMSKGTE
jgi:hypothetical protein